MYSPFANRFFLGLLLLSVLVLTGCEEEYEPFPRRMAYPRMELPQDYGHRVFSNEVCPLSFSYPDFGEVSRNETDSCWVDIYFAPFDSKWHFTYRDASATGRPRSFHFEEYRDLIYKHSKKASRIMERPFGLKAGYGTVFEIYGEVGTPMQFFMSDSSGNRLFMGSYYFNTAQKNDSLAPAIDLMKTEMRLMLESLEWK